MSGEVRGKGGEVRDCVSCGPLIRNIYNKYEAE